MRARATPKWRRGERWPKERKADMLAQADRTDRDLSLKAAGKIDTDAAAVKGREMRGMGGEKAKHPSIAGNIGSTGKIDNPKWGGGKPVGVSLGGYAPARGMSVFTVEPPVDAPISDYPNAKDRASPKQIPTSLRRRTGSPNCNPTRTLSGPSCSGRDIPRGACFPRLDA